MKKKKALKKRKHIKETYLLRAQINYNLANFYPKKCCTTHTTEGLHLRKTYPFVFLMFVRKIQVFFLNTG
jgi:hypothetical protein